MPRRRRLRRVVTPPGFKGYKPYGSNRESAGYIELLYEEYESLKLADYDLMNHLEASKLMGVSRATFARIYESARRKIAKALVESKEIKSVYGNALMDKNWYVCDECFVRFTIPPRYRHGHCPMCRSEKIELVNQSL